MRRATEERQGQERSGRLTRERERESTHYYNDEEEANATGSWRRPKKTRGEEQCQGGELERRKGKIAQVLRTQATEMESERGYGTLLLMSAHRLLSLATTIHTSPMNLCLCVHPFRIQDLPLSTETDSALID